MANSKKNAMFIIFLGFVSLMVPYVALSIPGDILYVQVDVANMRQGGSLKHPVINWLKKGHMVTEIQRKGEWVEVIADWEKMQTGWIHSSIVSNKFVGNESDENNNYKFTEFKKIFKDFNASSKLYSGRKLFVDVNDLGDGIIEIVATNFWLNEKTNMTYIHSLLNEIGEDSFPIAIHIVDQNGKRHMSIIREVKGEIPN